MRILGLDINFPWIQKAPVAPTTTPSGWDWNWLNNWATIQEPFTGAWQRNMDFRRESLLTFYAIYACITVIAGDIGKLRLRLMERTDDPDISNERDVPAFSPVLRKPNHYQTAQRFIEHWQTSKLSTGNTYVLKQRNAARIVDAMYVLNPLLTRPMIADDGSIWYDTSTDALAGIEENNVRIPASEIIHDVHFPLYHPLCGISPIAACALAAIQGQNIQKSSAKFFANGSNPGGILTAPGNITDATAKRLKDHWENNYTGNNVGKVAVLGDGLKYEQMMITATDSQLVNQLKLTAEQVCTAFLVPPHKISIGQMPNYNNIEALDQGYYSQCLQVKIRAVKSLLDEALGLTRANQYFVDVDLDDLLRMDTATMFKTFGEGVARGILSPNEARRKFGYSGVQGGDAPYLQGQNYTLPALDKRDSKEDPFAKEAPAPKPAAEKLPAPEPAKMITDQRPPLSKQERRAAILKGLHAA